VLAARTVVDLPARGSAAGRVLGQRSSECQATDDREEVRLGIAADEVIGTFTTSDPLLVDEAPRDVPHCCGMLRHEDRLALALDLKRLTEAFPVGVI